MGPLRLEAVVIRSLRYGEADRILHIYSRERGRLSGIAKGARKLHSRLGGRLEPYQLLALDLHEGRSELLTVTGAEIIRSNAGLRRSAVALEVAARCTDALGRLFATEEPHPEVFNLLCNLLFLLNERPQRAGWPLSVAFHLKLLVAAGILPRVGVCVGCGRAEAPFFSAAAGGTLCRRCLPAAGGRPFPFSRESAAFVAAALGRPLAEAPGASGRALREVERAVLEVAAHHSHVRLKATFGSHLRGAGEEAVAA